MGKQRFRRVISSPNLSTGDSEVHVAELSFTAAQIKACRATPLTLVAAPGAGKVLQLLGVCLIKDGASGYTETADNLAVKYTNGSGAAASDTIETTGWIDQTADKMILGVPIKDVIPVENAALVLHNTGDGEIGGTGDPVRAKVTYAVHLTGL